MHKVRTFFIVALCLLFALPLLSIFSCTIYRLVTLENIPVNQPLTKWMSEDETIYFETNESGAGYGTLMVNGQVFDIYFATGAGTSIDIYVIEEEKPMRLIERWTGNFISEEKFIATVDIDTTYFEKGEKIIFYRIDKKTSQPQKR